MTAPANTARNGTMLAALMAVDLLGGSGDVVEVASQLPGKTVKAVRAALNGLVDKEELFAARTGYHELRYFRSRTECAAYLNRKGQYVAPSNRTFLAKPTAARLAPDAPVVIPSGVRITQCPSHCAYDARFQLPPDLQRLPQGMQGAGFVKEWKRLRSARGNTSRSKTA